MAYVINGISYEIGSSFVCAKALQGNEQSTGTGGSSIALTVGATYVLKSVASGTSYPYLVSGIGWYTAGVFPLATYAIAYNANGGSGAPSSQTKTYNINLTLSTSKPTRTGYTFKGWATSASSATVAYTPGETYSANAPITLYAVWSINTYTISYNANGGSGAPSSQTKTYNIKLTLKTDKPTHSNASAGSYTVTLDANGGSCGTGSLTAARTTKYTFNKWNTAKDGSGTAYSAGGSYTANASATLYAQWTSTTTTAAVTLPTPARPGYKFKGWATSATATSGVTGRYTPAKNVTLYAVWEAQGLMYVGDGSTNNAYMVYIGTGTGIEQYVPYIGTGTGIELYS